MSFEHLLDPIWKTYEVTKDCLTVAQRAVRSARPELLSETDFLTDPPQASVERIRESRLEWEDFVVLSLWVAFERALISFVQTKGRELLRVQPASLAGELYQKFETDVEYWEFADILDLFRQNIGAKLLGDAKNIKRHRDWIAHRNPHRRSPGKVAPDFTYEVLSEILVRVEAMSI